MNETETPGQGSRVVLRGLTLAIKGIASVLCQPIGTSFRFVQKPFTMTGFYTLTLPEEVNPSWAPPKLAAKKSMLSPKRPAPGAPPKGSTPPPHANAKKLPALTGKLRTHPPSI